MNIFVTSDSHFSHNNIIGYCNRPFSTIEEMDEALIKNWNSVVSKEDTVYHLGDFALTSIGRIYEILGQLNGIKILVRGNHDRHTAKKYKEAGFAEVLGEKLLHYGKYSIYMRHKYNPDPVVNHSFFCHGHRHSSPEDRRYGKKLDVGVDCHNFIPWSIEEILEEMK